MIYNVILMNEKKNGNLRKAPAATIGLTSLAN